MAALLARFRRALRTFAHVERGLGVACIAIMVIAITTQVFTRYVLNQPIIWVEELATYCFIWGAFIGASLGLKHGRHVRIETYVGHLGQRGQIASRILVNVIVLVILGSLMGEVGKVIAIESRSTSVSLPIPIPRAWFYSIPLMVACASMAVTCAYLILAELSGLSGNRAFNTQHGVMDPPVQPQLPG
jgi:TRAP-type transport system small permease protein